MRPELIVGDHQPGERLPEAWLTRIERRGALAAERILAEHLAAAAAPLAGLTCIEVALVADEESARVHHQFLGIAGATDVITFDHGEIVIGVGVARRQAREHGEPEERELLRYVIHGLLHLAGHEDGEADQRAAMEAVQEALVEGFW